MASKQLYALVIPLRSQTNAGSNVAQNLQSQGVMSSDVPAVSSIAPEPGEETLQGHYAGRFSGLSATELQELFNSSGFDSIPYFAQDRDNPAPEDGYYSLRNVSVNPLDPRGDGVHQFDGSLTREGSRRSHWRAIKTSPTTVNSPWGGNPGALFAVSSLAKKVRWYDEAAGTVEDATPTRTEPSENGDVDIYDADAGPGNSPTLLYDLPYEYEYLTDCRVWDDYDRPKQVMTDPDGSGAVVGSATVGSATVGAGATVAVETQWQRVFRTDHFFIGSPVVESGALRLIPDETNDVLKAYQWNDNTKHWDAVQLGISPWRLFDFDLTNITPATVEADMTFADTSTSPREHYTVRMVMLRGLKRARILEPQNAASIPSGLADRLAPIARYQNRSARESQTLLPRQEVTR